jgi:hypothetical protein
MAYTDDENIKATRREMMSIQGGANVWNEAIRLKKRIITLEQDIIQVKQRRDMAPQIKEKYLANLESQIVRARNNIRSQEKKIERMLHSDEKKEWGFEKHDYYQAKIDKMNAKNPAAANLAVQEKPKGFWSFLYKGKNKGIA